MFLIKTKPQNRRKLILLLILGLIFSTIENFRYVGSFAFLWDTVVMVVISIMLGNVTRIILDKLGFEAGKVSNGEILDFEEENIHPRFEEDRKDTWALNYGIFWMTFMIIEKIA